MENLGPASAGNWERGCSPIERCPSPRYHAKFGRFVENGKWTYEWRSVGKMDPLASLLSRSLKVIGTDTNRSGTCV